MYFHHCSSESQINMVVCGWGTLGGGGPACECQKTVPPRKLNVSITSTFGVMAQERFWLGTAEIGRLGLGVKGRGNTNPWGNRLRHILWSIQVCFSMWRRRRGAASRVSVCIIHCSVALLSSKWRWLSNRCRTDSCCLLLLRQTHTTCQLSWSDNMLFNEANWETSQRAAVCVLVCVVNVFSYSCRQYMPA